jgi:hypothetical protein
VSLRLQKKEKRILAKQGEKGLKGSGGQPKAPVRGVGEVQQPSPLLEQQQPLATPRRYSQ